jgi:hypothetical protein
MSRVKKQLVALAALFSLEFLSLGLLTNGTFSWIHQYVPPLLKEAPHADARAVSLDSPANTQGNLIRQSYGEPAPQPGVFLSAKEHIGASLRSSVVNPLFLRIIFAPKVSRYISKSVLNL